MHIGMCLDGALISEVKDTSRRYGRGVAFFSAIYQMLQATHPTAGDHRHWNFAIDLGQ